MTDAPPPLIAGNWKMNALRGDGLALARDLAVRVRGAGALRCEVLLCPPATLLAEVGAVLKKSPVRLGAQDCHAAPGGAHTGDISAEMLADAGCSHVILGHSERRQGHGESNVEVRAKVQAAHRAGLVAIVCVGETAAQRGAGRTLDAVGRQLRSSVPDGARAEDTVIAYEPVWAIGSGRTPKRAEVAEVHGHIRAALDRRLGAAAVGLRVLYGGSVTAASARALLGVRHVDGALVGGASLEAGGFWRIIESSL